MGEVYEAEDRDNARRVALKVLSQGLAAPVDRARFIREGRAGRRYQPSQHGLRLRHRRYRRRARHCHGARARRHAQGPRQGQGKLPPAKAVDAILEVISGLEAAADAGVLHRDVKPSNCFVDSDGMVKVGELRPVDFDADVRRALAHDARHRARHAGIFISRAAAGRRARRPLGHLFRRRDALPTC